MFVLQSICITVLTTDQHTLSHVRFCGPTCVQQSLCVIYWLDPSIALTYMEFVLPNARKNTNMRDGWGIYVYILDQT